ncbi:MAG: thiosulfate oxidation carrier protein SoxY [Rhodospirillales bacterium]|jgi:sulfur-oxidizing protein SoxY|nr:thiosulfate oxidation carrier protein SoxY [Rhodospirillales bacterium]
MTRDATAKAIISRRRMLVAVGGLVAAVFSGLLPRSVDASPREAKKRLAELTGGAPAKKGRVKVTLPKITDQAAWVPISVAVDSPMTKDDHVAQIHILAERNTVPRVATYYLGPANGRAKLSTRIRVKKSQIITAAAVMSDGSVFVGKARCKIVSGAGGCG